MATVMSWLLFLSFQLRNQIHSGINSMDFRRLEKQLCSNLFMIIVRHLCNVKSDQCGACQIWIALGMQLFALHIQPKHSVQH